MRLSFDRLRRLYATLRPLKPVQFTDRLLRRFRKPRRLVGETPPWRELSGEWVKPIAAPASLTGPRTFRLLNRDADLDRIGWQAEGESDLLAYNLHYFDDWTAEGAHERADWHRALEGDWIAANPPGTSVAWDPYPTSLRLVNLAKSVLAGRTPGEPTRRSMVEQALFLSRMTERHLQANHLFANAKGLLFAGGVIGGEVGDRLWDTGVALAREQIAEQFLPDGGHYERSPMYHALLTGDLLDMLNLVRAKGGDPILSVLEETATHALGAASAMTHPDGNIALFNDAAFDIAPTFERLSAYAKRLGLAFDMPEGSVHLPETGLVRVKEGRATLFMDAGAVGPDCQPGHAHADTLSIELSLGRERIIVNGGTSHYGDGPERAAQRSTAAHSTVEIAGQDSSDVWGGFRVGRRARIVDAEFDGEKGRVSAAHDGYRFLPGRPIHRRTVTLSKDDLVIRDQVEGGRHPARIIFHVAPGVEISRDGELTLVLEAGDGWSVRIHSEALATIHDEKWHPQFGTAVPSKRVEIALPAMTDHVTHINWKARAK